MDNKTLLQALLREKLLSEELSKKLLQEASLSGKQVEDLVVDRRLVQEEQLGAAKAKALGIPFKQFQSIEVTEETLALIPEQTVRNYKVVPISKTNDLLVVGMLHPDDTKAQEAVKFIAKQLKLNVGVYLISQSFLDSILRRYSPYKTEVEIAVRALNVENDSEGQRIVALDEKRGKSVTEEAPIIKIVASTLKEAVYQNASDIHIEPQRTRLRVRFRLDGDLQEVATFPIALHQPIVSRVKILSSLKIDETRIPQDGRFRTVLLGRDIDFRVATFPTPAGEKVAIRVLDPQVGLRGLPDMGLLGRNLRVIEAGIAKPYGMVLITGPTGSGKSTTLYALMNMMNKEDVNIVSLEDPVEYFIDGLNQSQVKPEIGYDFASGLRQILRQDPDVIMVGEIRDQETAGLAVHAALTGHIVLSTLHTNNSLGVVPRLIDMKVEPFLIPASVNLMLAQRLVSRLCDACKKPNRASPELQAIIAKTLDALSEEVVKELKEQHIPFAGPFSTYRAAGCAECHNKGVTGRIALFEVLEMTPELEAVVNANPTEQKILTEAKRQGMTNLRQDGIIKALKGVVSIEDVLRETNET